MLTATPGLSDYEWCNFQYSQHHSFFKQNFQSLFAVKKGELQSPHHALGYIIHVSTAVQINNFDKN